MHWAAKRGDIETLRYLHERGARSNIPATTDANLLPIHWAAAEGKIDALSFFLDIGQEINQQDSNGCTPAVIAVQFNQIDALIYLAKHGADLTLIDHNGDHCLHWAAYKGLEEMLELVLYFIPQELNKCDTFGQVRGLSFFMLISSDLYLLLSLSLSLLFFFLFFVFVYRLLYISQLFEAIQTL